MVTLRPITVKNWKECAQLTLDESQRELLPSNLYSIAEAQFYPEARSLAIYNDRCKMVGYVLFGRDSISGMWKVFRLMIDARHQRKGYGEAAMKTVKQQIGDQPDDDTILICYQDVNQVARKLYARLGFVEETGKVTALFERGQALRGE